MIWKKGIRFKEMPPLAMIQSISVQIGKSFQASQLISATEYAGLCRNQTKVPPGTYFFFMDFDTLPTGLHIYPPPEKQIVVKVRYLPKVMEI